MSFLRFVIILLVVSLLAQTTQHFMEVKQKQREFAPLLFPYGEMPIEADIRFQNPIVRLAMPHGSCTAWVVDKHYAITAGHCLADSDFKTNMKMFSEFGTLISDTVKSVGYDRNLDLGLLFGDFRGVRPMKVNFEKEGFPYDKSRTYLTCGYPLAQKHLACTAFIPTQTYYFQIAGHSHLMPGMSGGPVVDMSTGEAVAVNTAVGADGETYVSPIEGMLGLFQLED